MKLYLSETHSDEDGPMAQEGKLCIIEANTSDIQRLAKFFNDVANFVNSHDGPCHMHFRDSFDGWNKSRHIDISVDLTE